MKFKIVVPCFNSEKWIGRTIQSVLDQNYANWDLIILNDASTDGTEKAVFEFLGDTRINYVVNQENLGPLQNTWKGVRLISQDPNDIIVVLDGDDWLASPGVLSRVLQEYKNGAFMTHGSYQHLSNGRKMINRFDLPFDRKNKKHAVYHLRTFKRFLFDRVDEKDLKDSDGNFFRMTGDMALFFPMAEMAGESLHFISDILLVYNDENPLNDFKQNLALQEEIEGIVRGNSPYE